jgi:hypothetical protein
MIRTQIQFTEEQLERLRRIARDRQVSIAEVVRDAVDAQIRDDDPRVLRERMIANMGGFRSGFTDISERHDDYLAEDFLK